MEKKYKINDGSSKHVETATGPSLATWMSRDWALLNGISLENLNNFKKFKTFTSYAEFFPSSRSIYYFLKKEKDLKLISVNHANFSENISKNELSPTRQAQNAIFDFSKKSTFFMPQIMKIVLSPTPEAHFCGFASFEKF